MSDRWSELPDDELAERVAHARVCAEGPSGMPRVRLPPGVSYFVHDPDSHLVVMHRSFIVEMCDALEYLLARAQRAEASTAPPLERRPGRRGGRGRGGAPPR